MTTHGTFLVENQEVVLLAHTTIRDDGSVLGDPVVARNLTTGLQPYLTEQPRHHNNTTRPSLTPPIAAHASAEPQSERHVPES